MNCVSSFALSWRRFHFLWHPTYAPRFRQHDTQRMAEVPVKSEPDLGRVTSIEVGRFLGNAF